MRAAAAALAALAFGPTLVAGRRAGRRHVALQQPAATASAVLAPGDSDNMAPFGASESRTYLIAAFPDMEQVAYCHTPDNVWRPLVTGDLRSPAGVTVDSQSARLFVADPGTNVIWLYQLSVRPDGLLETVGARRAAVQGYNASGVATNAQGDLYFVGRAVPTDGSATDPFTAIYRMDATSIARGDPLNPVEVYSRANSGSPDARAWSPSGLEVDSFFIYWGNSEAGTTHGSVVKGTRMNLGPALQAGNQVPTILDQAFDEVSGITTTGTHVYFLTSDGVHGVLKADVGVSNPAVGLIATENNVTSKVASTPHGSFSDITWDGGNSLYVVTSGAAGAVYTLPALNTQAHSLEKFVDAPGIDSVAMYLHVHNQGSDARGRAPAAVTLLALSAATAAGLRLVRG